MSRLRVVLMRVGKVIHSQITKFHDDLRQASSLDEMIRLHEEQYVTFLLFLSMKLSV